MSARDAAAPLSAARRTAIDAGLASARWAFWALIIIAPFRLAIVTIQRPVPGVSSDYTDIRIVLAQLVLGIVLVAWAIALAAGHRSSFRLSRWGASAAAVLLVLIWVGVPVSIDATLSIERALTVSAFAALGVYVAAELGSVRDVAVPAALMIVTQAGVATAQAIEQHSLGLGLLGEHVLEPAASGISVVTSSAGVRLLRAYGLTDHPNILGGLLALGMIAIAAAWLGTTDRRVRLGMVIVAALATIALLLTFSRGAWIGLVAGALVTATVVGAARGSRASRPWLLLAGAMPVAIALSWFALGPYLLARADLGEDLPRTEAQSIDERLAISGAALTVVGAHPLLGTGIGTLPEVLASDTTLAFEPGPAHVVPLEIAAEDGLPAAAAYVLLIVVAFRRAVLGVFRAGDRASPGPLAVGLLTAVVTVGLFDHYPWTSAAGLAWLAIAVGLCLRSAGAQPWVHASGAEPTTARPARA